MPAYIPRRRARPATPLRRAASDARLYRTSPSDAAASGAVKPHDVERHQAIVVGAGSAGLAAAVALQRRGFETIVMDKSDAVGASWRSRYAELRLNSWRPMSKLQGRGMPRSTGRYPSRDDVVAYLDQFARRHAIELLFRTQLLGVDRDNELWRLDTAAGGNSGFDIASHLFRAGARVTLSMRTPPNLAARPRRHR